LNKFQKIDNSNDIQINETTTLLKSSFITYMNLRTNRILQEIHFEKMPLYQIKLLRNHHRRHQLLLKKKMVDVSPQIIFDINDNPFSTIELSYILRGLISSSYSSSM
jgi:hypothetical protein